MSPSADSFLLPDPGSLSLEYKHAQMDSLIVTLPLFPPLTALFIQSHKYTLELACTGLLVWGLDEFSDYVDCYVKAFLNVPLYLTPLTSHSAAQHLAGLSLQ